MLLPEPRDLELARKRGWYRARKYPAFDRLRDPDLLRRIAFYQPDSFGEEGRRICWWAPIRSLETARRRDLLPEEPDHVRADDEYHCLRLGPVERLPQPVTSRRGRRLLFLRTTEARITRGGDLNDLVVGTPIEERMYSALRGLELLPEREFWVHCRAGEATSSQTVSHFLDFALFCRERSLNIECDGDTWHVGSNQAARDGIRDNLLESNGWHILRFGTVDINHRMEDALGRIRTAINRYGGIVEGGITRRFTRRGWLEPAQRVLDLFAADTAPADRA